MPRRRTRQANQDEAVGLTALVITALLYRQLSALTVPWTIALALLMTSLMGTAIVWAVRVGRRRQRRRRMLAEALDLSPTDFELRIRDLLQDLGWEQVAHIGGRGDGGVDLRATYRGERWIVQCKRYRGRVDPKYLRDLEGARHHERADRALLVTTGRFTQQGVDWARGKPLELWDGTVLAERHEAQQHRLQDPTERQRQRRRTWTRLGSLATVNALVLLWAGVSAPVFVPDRDVSAARPDASILAAQPEAAPPIAVHAAAAPDHCGTATIHGVERLVLRAAPGRQSARLADYPAGTVVTRACDPPVTADGLAWQRVHIDDQSGWMSQRMLQAQP